MSERQGGCSCKATRYRLTEEPMFTHVCHCSICKRHTGTAFVTHIFIESAYLEVTEGRVEAYAGQTGSGSEHWVYRCPDCLSALYSHYAGNDQIALVKGGTLDDPASLAPGAHLWVETRCRGSRFRKVCLPLTRTMSRLMSGPLAPWSGGARPGGADPRAVIGLMAVVACFPFS